MMRISLIYLTLSITLIVHGFLEKEPNVKLKVKDTVEFAEYLRKLSDLLETNATSRSEALPALKSVYTSLSQADSVAEMQIQNIVNTLSSISDATTEDRLIGYTNDVNYMFSNLKFAIGTGDKFENTSVYEFAKEATSQGLGGLSYVVHQFVKLVSSGSLEKSFLDLYTAKVMKKVEKGEWCNNGQSANEFIYHAWQYSLRVITKAYVVILTSYYVRRTHDRVSYSTEISTTSRKYFRAVTDISNKVLSLITQLPVSLRRCDPERHERGKTYLEFTRLVQGFLAHKYVLNAEHSARYDCEDYQATRYYDHEDVDSTGPWKCYGDIYKCFTTYTKLICPATSPSRRFDGVVTSDGYVSDEIPKYMGNVTSCDDGRGKDFLDVMLQRQWTTHSLHSCGCYCDDINHPGSLRRISNHPASSDYVNNFVVTGVRFVSDGNIVYIDVQQGRLEGYGYVITSTVHWRDRSEYLPKDIVEKVEQLSWNCRSINLNPVGGGPDQAVIGVKVDRNADTGVLQLVLWVANVSYTTGKIINAGDNIWIAPDTPTSELIIDDPTIPTLAPRNLPHTEVNKFIQLQPSSWRRDAAQTVVPFLDIQEVATDPPTLISGLRLYYRSSPGYGGFLALEIYSFNYSDYIFSKPLIGY